MQIQTLITTATEQLAHSSDTPRLDAEVLLAFVLNKSRSYLRAWCDMTVTEAQQMAFEQFIQQRLNGMPIAYLTGQREFWSRDFKITPAVLIPRADTELLIELSLQVIKCSDRIRILDLGTGSGIIAVTLAAECPNAEVIAVDQCVQALQVAEQNAKQHQLTNIRFYQSHWFNTIPVQAFDLIVSNPPYIAEDDVHLQQGDLRFEPKSALIADNQGLSDIETIVKQAPAYLNTNGHLFIEHGYNQAKAVQAIFRAAHYVKVQTYHDLAQQPRVTYGQKP